MASMIKIGGRWVNAERVTYLVDRGTGASIYFEGNPQVEVGLSVDEVANLLNMTGSVDQVLAEAFRMLVREGLIGVSMENIVVREGDLPAPDMVRAVITQALEVEV